MVEGGPSHFGECDLTPRSDPGREGLTPRQNRYVPGNSAPSSSRVEWPVTAAWVAPIQITRPA